MQFIGYIVIGLPLMMYCLGRIGGPMGKALTYAYSRFGCRWCRVRRKKSEMTVQRLTESENNNDDIVPYSEPKKSSNIHT